MFSSLIKPHLASKLTLARAHTLTLRLTILNVANRGTPLAFTYLHSILFFRTLLLFLETQSGEMKRWNNLIKRKDIHNTVQAACL